MKVNNQNTKCVMSNLQGSGFDSKEFDYMGKVNDRFLFECDSGSMSFDCYEDENGYELLTSLKIGDKVIINYEYH